MHHTFEYRAPHFIRSGRVCGRHAIGSRIVREATWKLPGLSAAQAAANAAARTSVLSRFWLIWNRSLEEFILQLCSIT